MLEIRSVGTLTFGQNVDNLGTKDVMTLNDRGRYV